LHPWRLYKRTFRDRRGRKERKRKTLPGARKNHWQTAWPSTRNSKAGKKKKGTELDRGPKGPRWNGGPHRVASLARKQMTGGIKGGKDRGKKEKKT